MKPFRPLVFRIGYIDLYAPDVAGSARYYEEIIGARAVHSAPDASYLSLGLYHHDVCLRRPAEGSAATLGFQISSAHTLEQIGERLSEAGLKAQRRRGARPGVDELLRTHALGYDFEFFETCATPGPGFNDSGIAPNRIGHVALISPDGPRLVEFFTRLGFVETDWFDDVVTFLTCNRDHHVINVIHAPITKVHHVAFELRGQSEQFQACDRLARSGRPVLWGPTRHTAGHNLASYHYGPDRQLIELYTDMDVYLGDLGYFEPRPWHEALPQVPRRWPIDNLAHWSTPAGFDLGQA